MRTSTSSSGSLCPGCGRTNHGRQIHCLVCGTLLAVALQAALPNSRPKFCTHCGSRLQVTGEVLHPLRQADLTMRIQQRGY